MVEFLVWEDSRPQDSKGRNLARTSTVARGLIGVIHIARKWVDAMKAPSRVLAMSSELDTELEGPVRKKSRWEDESIDFTGKDLRDTVQPYEDTLVVTLQIRGFDIKTVMIDQGSKAEIMYPDLYEGLGLTLEDLIN